MLTDVHLFELDSSLNHAEVYLWLLEELMAKNCFYSIPVNRIRNFPETTKSI